MKLSAAEKSDIATLAAKDRTVYLASRKAGSTHRFALMCALQQAPASRTDSDYFRVKKPLSKQFEGVQGGIDLRYRMREAKKRGYVPNPNSHYDPCLAQTPGDPNAFIGPSEGRGKVAATLEAQRVAAEKKREAMAKRKKQKILAPDIVRRCAQEAIRKNPDLARKSKRELTEMMVDKHGREY